MSKKKLFWIAFFGLTLLEVGQMAYSHDKDITVMVSKQTANGLCDGQGNTGKPNYISASKAKPTFC
ncbi:hypothetical protein [Paraglaciecola sp.]|uniref:hypothetical protein n=1 Tax=Paraglaciecola sp. TaxID=1920173 RepID=UPI0030F40386